MGEESLWEPALMGFPGVQPGTLELDTRAGEGNSPCLKRGFLGGSGGTLGGGSRQFSGQSVAWSSSREGSQLSAPTWQGRGVGPFDLLVAGRELADAWRCHGAGPGGRSLQREPERVLPSGAPCGPEALKKDYLTWQVHRNWKWNHRDWGGRHFCTCPHSPLTTHS